MSVRLSVPYIEYRPLQQRAAGLLLSAPRADDIDRTACTQQHGFQRQIRAVSRLQPPYEAERRLVVLCDKAETELVGLTKRVRGLEEDFETTESRLVHTSTKLDEASKASDENERCDMVHFISMTPAMYWAQEDDRKKPEEVCRYSFRYSEIAI